MVAKIVYTDKCEDFKYYLENKGIIVETYDENHYKEKKKAILIKASCGTKMTPFIAFYNDDKELIKAFYGEDKSNKLNNIEKWLSQTNWEKP